MPLTQAEADALKGEIQALVAGSSSAVSPRVAPALPLAAAHVAAPTLQGVNTASWRLAFNEDWSEGLDFSRWSTVLAQNDRNGPGSSEAANHEAQWYINDRYDLTQRIKPWRVDGGDLVITADRMPPELKPVLGYNQTDLVNLGAYSYTSGLLHTRESFSQQYGYFEAEMVLPPGRGLWPAFWLLPQDLSWPPEIDVLEALMHEPNRMYTTVHAPGVDPSPHIEAWLDLTARHRYGVLWQPGLVTLYIDGAEAGGGMIATPPGVDKPMYMILNLAVGGLGSWPGPPDAATVFPAEMRVGPVRAWAF